jgi:hypothetical protein
VPGGTLLEARGAHEGTSGPQGSPTETRVRACGPQPEVCGTEVETCVTPLETCGSLIESRVTPLATTGALGVIPGALRAASGPGGSPRGTEGAASGIPLSARDKLRVACDSHRAAWLSPRTFGDTLASPRPWLGGTGGSLVSSPIAGFASSLKPRRRRPPRESPAERDGSSLRAAVRPPCGSTRERRDRSR